MIVGQSSNTLHVALEVRPTQGGDGMRSALAEARRRAVLRVAKAAQECGVRAVLVGDRCEAARLFGDDTPLPGAHQLSGIAGSVLWVRWGAGALLTGESACRLGLAARDGCIWGNRPQRADLWAFPGGTWPKTGSKPQKLFPPAAATMFRIATAGDLCLLDTLGPRDLAPGESTRPAPVVAENIRAVTRVLTKRTAELVVVGDPGSEGWRHLEQETACRVRLLGDAPGGLLTSLLASVGAARFVRYLSELGEAFLVNTRILFRESDWPAPDDFFYSDMGLVARVAHRGLRRLTEALLNGDRPAVLGGNSLLTGGIYLLIERAWERKDLPRQYETVPVPSAKQITKE